MKRILLIKTSSLGDVIHNCPVIHDIHKHFVDAHIDWVVEESFADIPRMHAGVNQVYTVAMRRWRKQLFKQKTWQEISQFKQQIQQNQYDIIIDTQGLLKSALISKLAKGVKHGYDKASIREPIASNFYDVTHACSYQQHAVTRNRTLVALSLGYTPPTDAPNYGLSAVKLASVPAGKYVIGLHGTSKESKLWPTLHWINLGKALAEHGYQLVLPWASAEEESRANVIKAALSNATVLDKLTIGQLAVVINHTQAAVGVDTGLSHLAAALDIPTIAIYTDTNPALTGVMAGAHQPAVNLGDIAQVPSVDEVMNTLLTFKNNA
ncbi:MAG TPA: lipopolysaccharide heptosyltransferase I [Methylotenera sp.]|nr:lipopolysaccharide heptosyltransferase I [Methylotenera sp.]HPH06025.1 lipopolysaccharide heptosyltransferase I [Methylotenera sp.]HPN00603.1 lipopolysaccharide heptosyltransferase I [Methylotenera sp.]